MSSHLPIVRRVASMPKMQCQRSNHIRQDRCTEIPLHLRRHLSRDPAPSPGQFRGCLSPLR